MELESVTLSVWFLIGAVLVFFMQSGFAMVECGFTRAKNAGNILMKTWWTFAWARWCSSCWATACWWVLTWQGGIYRDPHPGHVWGGVFQL